MFLGNINTRNLLSVPHACCHYMKRGGAVGGVEGGAGGPQGENQVRRAGSAVQLLLACGGTVPDATLKALG